MTIAVSIGLACSFLAISSSYIIMRVKYFREALYVLEKYGFKQFPRDKRGLRKLRKIKPVIEKARRRMAVLFFVHLSIFVLAYSLMVAIIYSLIPPEHLLVKIPVAIPLITGRIDNVYVTHVIFIAFIAFMQPSYLFMRAVKVARTRSGETDLTGTY